MIRFNATQTVADLHALEHELEVVAAQALGQGSSFALRHARATTKFKDRSHKLRDGLERIDLGPTHIRVRSRAKHTIYVEEDTSAHVIRPKRTGTVSSRRSASRSRPRLLTFQIAGRWISKRQVKHPGTTGTHFMRDAAEASEVFITRFVELGVNRAIG